MKKMLVVLLLPAFGLAGHGTPAHAGWSLDLESGRAWSGYNNVRIPGGSGTRFSLSRDLDAEAGPFVRARLGWQLSPQHDLSLLIAPLRLEASGRLDRSLRFFEEEFPAGTPLEARYVFHSYRLTYRRTLVDDARWRLGAGFTAKIRDAAIRVAGGGRSSEKTNVGFVPLLHFRVERRFGEAASLLLEGDALAAPQGRAEDVLLAGTVRLAEPLRVKAGYRVVEGGADNDEVYTFALIHYVVLGLIAEF